MTKILVKFVDVLYRFWNAYKTQMEDFEDYKKAGKHVFVVESRE